MKLQPNFDTLEKPETIINHVKRLTKKEEPTPHAEILHKLSEQFKPLDFEALVYPEITEIRKQLNSLNQDTDEFKELTKQLNKFKVTQKHLLILTVENVLEVAKNNHWGLCKNNSFIYLYNGTYWAALDKGTFQKFLGEASEKMGVAKFTARYYHFREELFKQFISTAYLPTPEIDKATVLVNLLNGTFEISPSGTRLRPFDPSDFLTYQLPFGYNPEATAPKFKAYLDRVLPDIESQNILAEYLGFVFIRHGSNRLKEEKALMLYGTGANGKSVFFEIVNALLGTENVSSYSLQSITEKNGYFRANLANKLVNYASEINGNLETSTFKQMVSGEPVEARLPYGQPFNMKQYAKFIFNVNELPKDVEHTNAYFRRFLIIPFEVTIPEEEQDKNLHTKIIETELAGVFNWVLEGLNRLLKQQRFSRCEAAQKAIEQYKTESNSVKMFLDEYGYKPSALDYQIIKELYKKYKDFCIDDGLKPFKKVNFSKQLKALGVVIERQGGTGKNIARLEEAPL